MKKLTTLLLAAIMLIASVFALTACDTVNAAEDYDRVIENNVLRVGMECAYPPFNWTQLTNAGGALPIYNEAGHFANGFDVTLAKHIADELGVELQIHKMEWDSLIPALRSGSIDLIIAGMSPTADRRLQIDFSDAYGQSNLVIIIRNDGNFTNATKLSDFNSAKIAAQLGTFHAKALQQIVNPVPTERLIDEFDNMVAALSAKTIDGFIAEEPTALAYCLENAATYSYIALRNNSTGFNIEDPDDVALAAGLRKNSSLTEHVNNILAEIGESILQRWMDDAVDAYSAS